MIEYDLTPNVHFFLCRQCRAHIALTQEFVFNDVMIEAGIFRTAVNVHVDDPARYRREGRNMIADVNCDRCRILLGWKFVEVAKGNIVVQPGRFLLYLNKLLVWDGNRMLCADTSEPVENA